MGHRKFKLVIYIDLEDFFARFKKKDTAEMCNMDLLKGGRSRIGSRDLVRFSIRIGGVWVKHSPSPTDHGFCNLLIECSNS